MGVGNFEAKLKIFSVASKGNLNKAPVRVLQKYDVNRVRTYPRLNATSSESILWMTLTSLPAQCPRAL